MTILDLTVTKNAVKQKEKKPKAAVVKKEKVDEKGRGGGLVWIECSVGGKCAHVELHVWVTI